MALLEIRNVSRRFGELQAVDDVSLSIEAGEFFTLVGPSGCGKTTLLRLIAGFDQPRHRRVAARRANPGRHSAREKTGAHGFPELRAVSAHDRGAERRFSLADGRQTPERDQPPSQGGSGTGAPGQQGSPVSPRIVRRTKAARRSGACADQQAAPAVARRTAGGTRRQAARADHRGTDRTAARGRHHLRLRHPFAAGGAGGVAPHRGHE
jgi:energy-coupling factor transporter ATP-binding protein EcfA2